MIRALLLSSVLAALIAAPAGLAQDAAPPRFFIERIEVRNHNRVSPEVIIAESRLREGSEYSEADLRDASTRLARLPFLLSAEFALERGSERGRHILIIDVVETRSFFFRLEFIPTYTDEGRSHNIDFTTHLGQDETSLAAGYRWFLGRRGALHVAVIARDHTEFTSGYSAVAAGYTQYDVFGTGGFVTLNIKHNVDGGSVSPQLVAGLPLSLNQTVTVEYDENVTEYHYFFDGTLVDKSRTQRVARATWSYNTTNHPFFPTNGALVSVAPLITWQDHVLVTGRIGQDGVGTVRIDPLHVTAVGIQATGVRYWELTDRVATSAGVEVGFARFDERSSAENFDNGTRSSAFAGAQATLSRSLWSPEQRAQGGDSRIEVEAQVRAREEYRPEAFRIANQIQESLRASVSWLRQSSWGNLRIGVGYGW